MISTEYCYAEHHHEIYPSDECDMWRVLTIVTDMHEEYRNKSKYTEYDKYIDAEQDIISHKRKEEIR
jgi:hypothetical protein